MIIKKLEVAGLRAFEQAKFEFQPGMNLLVGVNGVGKTTVLDALRICLSKLLPEITVSPSKKDSFNSEDIRFGRNTITITLEFELHNRNFQLLIHKQRARLKTGREERGRIKYLILPDKLEIQPPLTEISKITKEANQQPIGIYYSTRRSQAVDNEPSQTSIAGGQAAAFSESLLINRDFNLREIAQWIRAQEVLGEERPIASRHIATLSTAVYRFLEGFLNLRVIPFERGLELMVDKDGIPLKFRQLSDGERGILSLILDLARRLSQANPDLDDPVKDGVAVVLIDELDLHLHPQWQRTIVERLTNTFQNCQFIATTHSPQVIGEVKPERITIIDDVVYNPSRSFGIDSSRILEELMDTKPRNVKMEKLLSDLFEQIDKENLKNAKELLNKAIEKLGVDDPEITRATTLINFLEDNI